MYICINKYICGGCDEKENTGKTVPRARIRSTSLAFRTSVLIIIPHGLLDVIILPMPTIYAAPCFGGQCRLLTTHMYIPVYTYIYI